MILSLLDVLPHALTTRLVLLTTGHGPGTAPFMAPAPVATPTGALTGAPAGVGTAPATPALGPVGGPLGQDTSSGLGDFTWTQVVTLAGALIAAAGVVITLLFNAAKSRRDALATLYADALGAVAEYLEGPYRILRKDGTATTRVAITSKLSDVKTAIDHNQALLRLHADPGVADAYDAFVQAAKDEAGKQMHAAWKAAPVTTDEGVNLHVSLPRGDSEAARARLVAVMQADLRRRWYKSDKDYRAAVAAAASPHSDSHAHNDAANVDAARVAPSATTTSTTGDDST